MATNLYTWNCDIALAARTTVHFVAAVQFSYAFYYDIKFVYPPKHHPAYHTYNTFGGKFRYLTVLNTILQAFYFTICTLNDLFDIIECQPKRSSTICQFRDYIFAAFAFPVALHVTVLFWSIYAVDCELIVPKSVGSFVPSWLNHIMHTNVAIFVLVDLILTFREYPNRVAGFIGLIAFIVAYMIWMHIIRFKSGRWGYPVLDTLNLHQRMIFMLVYGVFGTSFYFVGEFLNNVIWSEELKSMDLSKI